MFNYYFDVINLLILVIFGAITNFERRLLLVMTTNNKYFLKKELATRYRVSISTIERWVYDKNLPLPIRIDPNRILWDMQEILDWERSRKESR